MAAPPTQCTFCQVELLETDVKSEMPCHRFFHTACLVNLWFDEDWNHFDDCAICQPLLGGHGHGQNQNDFQQNYDVPNQDEVQPRQRIRNLFDTDEQFRKKVKELVKQKTIVTKARSVAEKLNRTKKGEIRNQLLLIKAQLQGLIETKQEEVQTSVEYKEYMKSKRKYGTLMNHLEQEYRCRESCLRDYLNDKPGMRRFDGLRRWKHSRYTILTRPWRYRVPI